MFKHILLPTDGSDISETAIRQAVQFARETGAMVTGFHAIPEFHVFTYQAEMLEDTPQQYRKDSETHARACLGRIEDAARGCDLIAMASHGRTGLKGLLLGSQTQKVLAHSTIPVLVYR